MNRETYLKLAAEKLADLFAEAGAPIPANVRVSCGWPGGGSRRTRIGECWSTTASRDGHFEIFISPALAQTSEVLAVLVHELVHAAVGLEAGHGAGFRKIAKRVGLVGKMRSTTAGEELAAKLAAIATEIGSEYPHAELVANGRKKQTTRMIKCECGSCGYTVRTSSKWLDTWGAPLCPCNSEPMAVAQ